MVESAQTQNSVWSHNLVTEVCLKLGSWIENFLQVRWNYSVIMHSSLNYLVRDLQKFWDSQSLWHAYSKLWVKAKKGVGEGLGKGKGHSWKILPKVFDRTYSFLCSYFSFPIYILVKRLDGRWEREGKGTSMETVRFSSQRCLTRQRWNKWTHRFFCSYFCILSF